MRPRIMKTEKELTYSGDAGASLSQDWILLDDYEVVLEQLPDAPGVQLNARASAGAAAAINQTNERIKRSHVY